MSNKEERYPPIFALALTGYPAKLIPEDREVQRPTMDEFYAWIAAGKPGASWKDCSFKYTDDDTDVGRIV